jgi:hypothetical protein
VKHIRSADKDEIDSLISALQTYSEPGDDVEKMIEIVLCEPDIIAHEEIMRSIHIALQEIDMTEIEREIREAKKDIAEHSAILERESHTKLEQLKDCDSLNKIVMVNVKEAMEIARDELENLNLESIVNMTMTEVNQSIQDLDIELIVADVMEDAREALEEEHVKVIKIRQELDEKKMDLAEQEVRLKEREARLKHELKELEEQLKEIKQKQKEESKKSQ